MKEKGAVIKEVSRVVQIQPVREITRETITIDSDVLANVKKELSVLDAWKSDIQALKEIPQKLQANPPTTSHISAPIYIGNDCTNDCMYCAFRRTNQDVTRRTLDNAEIRVMGKGSLLDYGMFLENIMVAARARGLDTCPQAAFNAYHALISEHLGLDAEREMVVVGMALGHADPQAIENSLLSERVPVSDFATFWP
ncbi:MAG: hypothetical protein UX67_C0054G0004 [Candidatus Woesebacteria bacterium GW2011_GWF2_46_8]|uniref:Nitroreductase domain-containing protein n=1 Tax=Candidatus Woesebacteria bacterium GW2011_GWF2_46_8 TaxID=1618604 RepID=A0A0G1QPY3_9BACT|nr:MAG: hypothetical protein UX67_C0054G0004 [Candidatus Woesebacteria bacterium GW2011_GWF2_46_8]